MDKIPTLILYARNALKTLVVYNMYNMYKINYVYTRKGVPRGTNRKMSSDLVHLYRPKKPPYISMVYHLYEIALGCA
jgi:hypothetical protein